MNYKSFLLFIIFIFLCINISAQIAIDSTMHIEFGASFEQKSLAPDQSDREYGLNREYGGEIYLVENPSKNSTNNSDYVMKVATKKSSSGGFCRAEYFTEWSAAGRFETKNKRHIYQWMVYFPDDYLVDIDKINGSWHIISQFVTHPCAEYSSAYPYFRDSICGTGGIFNEISINRDDFSKYNFEYRAYPDCNELEYTFTRGQWTKFTYEILWTTGFNGYYRAWANEKLIGEAYNVRTLPGGWIEGECNIIWKVGLYDNWYDSEIDVVYYYLDNLKVYVD
jgi:hypothetical protein